MNLNSLKWIVLIVIIVPCIKGHYSCPSGYQFIYNQCVVMSRQIQCPYGSILSGERCIQSNGNCYSYCNQESVLTDNICLPVYHQPCTATCQPFTTQTLTACQNPQPVTPAPCSSHTSAVITPTPAVTTTIPTVYTCPNNMVWDSTRCVRESKILITNVGITNVANNKNIIHQPVNVTINNSNTVYLRSSDGTLLSINQAKNNDSPTTPPIITGTEPPTKNCCTIITPRICRRRFYWQRTNRRYARCGHFCSHPSVYLRNIAPIFRSPVFILTPPSCEHSNCSYIGGKDCSVCITNMNLCPNYCYEPYCRSGDCGFYDQEEYCRQFPRSVGYFQDDGCYGDWCG